MDGGFSLHISPWFLDFSYILERNTSRFYADFPGGRRIITLGIA